MKYQMDGRRAMNSLMGTPLLWPIIQGAVHAAKVIERGDFRGIVQFQETP